MRRQDDVVQPLQRRRETLCIRTGLDRKHVNRGAAQRTCAQRIGERLKIDHRAAAVVDQVSAVFHRRDLGAADHAVGGGRLRHVQSDNIALCQQFVQARNRLGVAVA
jgi:hypothetical protein